MVYDPKVGSTELLYNVNDYDYDSNNNVEHNKHRGKHSISSYQKESTYST